MNTAARSGFAPGATALAVAAQALADVVREGGCIAEEAMRRVAPPADEAGAVRAILSGTLRWYLRLAPAVDALLARGQRITPPVHALLVAAVHQVEYSRAVPASVVNIAVDAARVAGQGAASGFVNALLRRYLRERDGILARIDRSEAAALAHPRWLLKAIRAAWPDAAADILAADNEAPPMTLRVNLARTTREACLAALAERGIRAEPGRLDSSLVLGHPLDVQRIPGFAEGLVSVQDAGAQRAAELLDPRPGERVLDACAAPGGKAGHLLERVHGALELTALDVDPARLARVQQNLERLRYGAHCVAGDVLAATPAWWDGRPFQRILLDAPCSGTGVIRRHPDIKLLRRPADIERFAATQLAMLERCAALLAPGGRLLYATCSILPEENQQVVARFLARQAAGRFALHEEQWLPARASAGAATLTDGFYYAALDMTGTGT